MNKIMFGVLIFLMLNVVVVSAEEVGNPGQANKIEQALNDLRGFFCTILPIAIMLMIVAAAVIFAIGQIMGAETRARANVWATNMMIGVIIGAVIYVLVPYLLGTLLGTTFTCPSSYTSS